MDTLQARAELIRLLDRDHFAAWLGDNLERRMVGVANDEYACPVATYLQETIRDSLDDIAVHPEHVQARATDDEVHLAYAEGTDLTWVACFVHEVDACDGAISGSLAMALLNDCGGA